VTEYHDRDWRSALSQTDLEKAFLAAAEIAKKLPRNLQETGFQRALDQLVGSSATPAPAGRARIARRASGTAPGERSSREVERTGAGEELLQRIDRTAHADVGATARVADRALKVLQLAQETYGVDGLTAAEIAEILSMKFRLPVKANSVTKALEREAKTVDMRLGPAGSRVFHIMEPGEKYLQSIRTGSAMSKAPTATEKARRSTRRERLPQRAKEVDATAKKHGKNSRAVPRNSRGRPGPKASIGQLIDNGFFRSARTIAEIQEELRHRRGHSYSVQELAPALVRSTRDGTLSRARNKGGQYEYTAA
jgi:hypothetical protein